MPRLLPPSALADKALVWFDANARALPWRARPGERADPYRVWLSEILLQQTTTAGAAPYFAKFTSRWPDVSALAAAPIEEVMSAFAGLGYYSRARNLHAAARTIAAAGGAFPSQEAALRALPGIGPYTAAAIAAIAFDKPATPIDGNIARIVSRLAGFTAPIAGNRRSIEDFARTLTPERRAGDFAQALMDIGATICRPKAPACLACPLRGGCRAAASGDPEAFPGRPLKKPRPAKVGAAFFAERPNGAFLARRRPPKGLLGGTMELPGGDWRAGDLAEVGPDEAPFVTNWRRLPEPVEHVFTHFSLRLALYSAPAPEAEPPAGFVFVAPDEIDAAGFSGLMRKAILSARAKRAGSGANTTGRDLELKAESLVTSDD
jgi:A/G-specific adenine glycosylase